MTMQLKSFAGIMLMGAALVAGPNASVHGEYIEARTADVFTGPCFANSEMNLTGDTAVLGWHINKGTMDGVSIDGLSVVGVIRAKSTLGDVTASPYPVQSVLILDDRATPAQQMALTKFAKRMGGDLFQSVLRVDLLPIEFTLEGSVHSRKATLSAGTLAKIQTRAMEESDQICHNEATYYPPLTKTDHAMAAFTLANDYKGKALGTTWSSPLKRSAFVGTFSLSE